MSDEPSHPVEQNQTQADDDALRREQLLAKVHEANKQSLTGPDSPSVHLFRE